MTDLTQTPQPAPHQPTSVILGGILYNVTFADGQVIFDQAITISGHYTQFAFEKPNDINNTAGIWWLVHLEKSSDRIPASHIAEAYQWCCNNYGKSFEPMKGIK